MGYWWDSTDCTYIILFSKNHSLFLKKIFNYNISLIKISEGWLCWSVHINLLYWANIAENLIVNANIVSKKWLKKPILHLKKFKEPLVLLL